jgi:short-subunit dehydrogenase
MGIGLELARLLARHGHSLVLVARSEDKLNELSRALIATGSPRVTVCPADLADPGAPARIATTLAEQGITIDYLVNNAGFGSTGPFLASDIERELEMVRVNVSALVHLTRLFASGMAERHRGGVLNIASTAAFQPGPNMATYYATKAYVLSFTEALAEELRGTGVRVTAYCPGPVATEFARTAGNAESMLFKMAPAAKPEDVALGAYASLERGQVVAVHGFMNWMGVQVLRLSPRVLVRRFVAWVNSTRPRAAS